MIYPLHEVVPDAANPANIQLNATLFLLFLTMFQLIILNSAMVTRSIGLHCNQSNGPAVNLYMSLGYRKTKVLEPAVMPLLNGRYSDGQCNFFIKRLPTNRG